MRIDLGERWVWYFWAVWASLWLLLNWNHHCYHDYCSSSYTHRTHKSQTHEKIMTQIEYFFSTKFHYQGHCQQYVKIHTLWKLKTICYFLNNIICKLWRRNLENTMINEWRDDLSITLFYRNCTFIGDWITSVNCIIKFSKTALRAHRICCPAIEKPPCTLAKDLCPFCYDLCSSLRSFKRWKNHNPTSHS